MKSRSTRVGGLAAVFVLLLSAPAQPACVGDCNEDNVVTAQELVTGVDIVLGTATAGCPAFDRNHDASVTVDELAQAVDAALNGCPVEPTATSTETATDTPTPTPTPTNAPPAIPDLPVYRTYPGYPVAFPIGAIDPEGGDLAYGGTNLPDGAQLDPSTGLLSWTPAADQLGPFYAHFTVTDQAAPPLASDGVLPLKVSPLDDCAVPSCDPASGCTSALVPVDTSCCSGGEPQTRVAEPDAACPGGLVLQVGRNRNSGFGELHDCDLLRAAGGQQSGGTLRVNIRVRCVNLAQLVSVHLLLETADHIVPLLVNQTLDNVFLDVLPGGWGQRLGLSYKLPNTAAPDGTEANLTVTLTDHDGVIVQDKVRVVLTPNAIDDLPD